MSHVAWSCDGKKLAAVGIDKIVRVWQPEKSVSFTAGAPYLVAHGSWVSNECWDAHTHRMSIDGDSGSKHILWCPYGRC